MASSYQVSVFDDGRIEIADGLYPLKMVIVSGKNIRGLPWNHPCVYVLRGGGSGGEWSYVGKSQDLSRRPANHNFEWSRALLICRSDANFNTAEIGWLEGRLYRLLKSGGIDLKNVQTPGDDTLAPERQEALEHQVRSIRNALALLGLDLVEHRKAELGRPMHLSAPEVPSGLSHSHTASVQTSATAEPSSPSSTQAQQRRKEPILLHNPAAAGKVHRKLLGVVGVGSVIKSVTHKYEDATATVEDIGIRYGTKLYGSLSAAARAVTGNDAVDGWSFWGVRGESGELTKLKDVRDGKASVAPSSTPARQGPKAKPAAVGGVHRKLLGVVDVGSVIKSVTHKYELAAATVEDTGIRHDGQLYGSLSAAARAVTGNNAVDGWSFWGAVGESGQLTKLKDIRYGRATIAQAQRRTRGRKAKPVAVGKVHRKLLDVIDVGTVIKSVTHKYEGAAATVENTGIRYDGKLYGSPSAAAKAATGNEAVDGWSFWGVQDEFGQLRRLKDVRDEK